MQKKKEKIVTLRMTEADKNEIQRRAKKAHMTMTDYLTSCGLNRKIVQVDGLDDILRELKAQGNNINQLTMLAHMGRVKVLRVDKFIEIYSSLCNALQSLTEKLNEGVK